MGILQKEEEILYKGKPEGRTLGMWIIKKVLLFVFYLLIIFGWIPLSLWYISGYEKLPGLVVYITGFIFILIVIALYQIPLLRSHKYVITNQKIIVKAGVISKRERNIPLNKITNVTVSQNLFEQIFGLFRLRIQTAVEMGEVSFVGLGDVDTPKNIISSLIEKTKSR